MAWTWQTLGVIYDDGATFTVEVEGQDTTDGQIRTVRLTNNTQSTHFAAAMYKNTWQPSRAGQACLAGQTVLINLPGNVGSGDVQYVSLW